MYKRIAIFLVKFLKIPPCLPHRVRWPRWGSAVLWRSSTARKPPLCKGRWHGASRDGGIVRCRAGQSPSQPVRLTAPFTQGGLFGSSGSAHQGKNLSFRGRLCRPWESPGRMSPLLQRLCSRETVPGDCHGPMGLAMTGLWCVALVGAVIDRLKASL